MRLNLKMIAVAAAMVATGSANAAYSDWGTGDGSFTLFAANTSTGAYYLRDLGVTLNQFLPNSITTGAGDGGVTGNRTPGAGLTLNSGNTASFAGTFGDASWSTWFSAQAPGSVVWGAVAGDSLSNDATDLGRFLTTSKLLNPTLSNGSLDVATDGSALGGLGGLLGTATSVTGTNTAVTATLGNNGGTGSGLVASIGDTVGLYYYVRSTDAGQTGTSANRTRFGNSGSNFAKLSLDSSGNFSYVLDPAETAAVPLPAAAWLLGAGMVSMGGFIRRRRAASQTA